MQITIFGISHETYVAIHDHFMPRTIITSSIWNDHDKAFTIELTNKAYISASEHDVRIFLGSTWYDLKDKDFNGLALI